MVKQYSLPVICTATFRANLPANNAAVVSFVVNPLTGPRTSLVVPQGEAWVLKDCYVKGTADVPVDAMVRIRVNDREDVYMSPPLSSLLVSNPSRPRVERPRPMFKSGDTISGLAINLAPIGASDVTVTFYLEFFVAAPD